MNKNVQVILEKPMNRKEFLGYIGAAVLTFVGFSGMIKALLNHNGSSGGGSSAYHPVTDGYGSTNYGGLRQ